MSDSQPQTPTVRATGRSPQPPGWFQTLTDLYRANVASAFSLTGNVEDYVMLNGGQPAGIVTDFLSATFRTRLVVTYDRSGFQFPVSAEHEELFRTLSGISEQPAAPLMPRVGAAPAEGDAPPLPQSPVAALALLDKAMRQPNKQRLCVIINMGQTIAPNAQLALMTADDRDVVVTLRRWASDPVIETNGALILMLSDGDIHPIIKKTWRDITIPLPDANERAAFVKWWLQEADFTSDLSEQEIVTLTAGLNLHMVEDIFLAASLTGALTRSTLVERKKTLVRQEYGDVIEIIDPQYGFEGIGGLDWIKAYFQENIVTPMQRGDYDIVPMGVLMPGPPGTGKSAFAIACAREAAMLVFKLNLGGQIASKWQGEGERNLRRAFDAFDGAGQCVVFIDEIDNAFSRGGQGSGNNQQESRIFQMLLEYMSDTTHRGKVVFLAATNRPDNIDPAVIRSGRFDDIVPFPIPDSTGRKAIFEVMAKRFNLSFDHVPASAVSFTKNWSGAEIEAATMKAKRIMRKNNAPYEDAIIQAVSRLRSRTSRDAEQMQRIAFEYASDIDFLPPNERTNYARAMELASSPPTITPRANRKRRDI